MAIKNCPKCGRLFSDDSGVICAICRKEDENVYEKVRTFIKENPDCTIAEVATATEVSQKKISRYIREGRIEISKGMLDDVRCDACGQPITTGRFCETCAHKLKIDLHGSIAGSIPEPVEVKKADPGTPKMHFKKWES